MSSTDLKDGFARLLDSEPPMHLNITPVVRRGRRLRMRRRMGYAAGGLGVAGMVGAAVVVPLMRTNNPTQPHLNIAPVSAGQNSGAAAAGRQAHLQAQQARVVAAIESASPEGWTFTVDADRWDGINLEGEVNDGAGSARLMVGVSPTNGSQQLHPCRDAEYRQSGTCTERTLADGSVLSLRGLVDYQGVRYVDVALTHPDGSGVNLENGNFRITWPLPQRVYSAEEKQHLTHIVRDDPAYTVEQLGEVALAVDRALSQD